MIFTAYMDEAATHGPNPRMTMAGLLGNAYEWRRLETKLGRLQKQYGFTIFHAKDFKAHKGEFRGWAPERYLALTADLTDLMRATITEGLAITLPHDVYLAEYRADAPAGMHLDSQYGLCFRACLAHMAAMILSRGGSGHSLHVVIELGHKNVGDCIRIFYEIKKELAQRGTDVLATITIAEKTDPKAKPLMVADFLAHTHYLFDAASKDGKAPTYAEMTVGVPNKKYDAGLSMMLFRVEALRGLKERFIAEKKRRADWGAAIKAKRTASLGERPS